MHCLIVNVCLVVLKNTRHDFFFSQSFSNGRTLSYGKNNGKGRAATQRQPPEQITFRCDPLHLVKMARTITAFLALAFALLHNPTEATEELTLETFDKVVNSGKCLL